MSIFIGNSEIKNAYIGTTPVKEIYVGTTKVRPAGPAIYDFRNKTKTQILNDGWTEFGTGIVSVGSDGIQNSDSSGRGGIDFSVDYTNANAITLEMHFKMLNIGSWTGSLSLAQDNSLTPGISIYNGTMTNGNYQQRLNVNNVALNITNPGWSSNTEYFIIIEADLVNGTLVSNTYLESNPGTSINTKSVSLNSSQIASIRSASHFAIAFEQNRSYVRTVSFQVS